MTTTTKDPIQLHALQVTFRLDAHDTDGQATAFETRVPAGAFVPPPHSHDGFDETVYVLEGAFTFHLDGRRHDLDPGQALFIGRGQVHRFDNRGGADGVFLSVATPGVFGPDYFLDIAELLDASAGGPPDRELMTAAMARHGLTMAPPPPA